MKKNYQQVVDNRPAWKRRPSEIRGYHRTLYYNTEDGDYLRVDYNLGEKRVRLYVEIESEGGNAYYAVISNGRITAEKSVSTGRSFGFADKFKDRADAFSTVTNKEVLKLINKNYGIGKTTAKAKTNSGTSAERQKRLQETRERYFKSEYGDDSDGKRRYRGPQLKLVDLYDLLIGLALSAGLFLFYNYSYIALGVSAAFYGIIIGIVDMFFRDRDPLFMKVLLFLVSGIVFYIYGYFYAT